MSLIGAAAIAGGANLIGGFINASSQRSANRTNLRIAREQNAANYKMFREQNAFNEQMWNKQQEYNTPLNQRERYEQAGINPYLAMSNIQSGNAQSALASAVPAPAQGATMQPVTAFGDAVANGVTNAVGTYTQLQQARKTKAEADNQEILNRYTDLRAQSEINDIKQSFRLKGLQGSLANLEYKFRSDTFQQDLNLKDLNVAASEQVVEKLKLSNIYQDIVNNTAKLNLDFLGKYGEDQIRVSIQNGLADLATKAQQIVESNARIRQGDEKISIDRYNAHTNRMNAHTNRMNAHTNRMNAQTQAKLVDEQVKLMGNQIKLIVEQTSGQHLTNVQTKNLIPILVDQARQTLNSVLLDNAYMQNRLDDYTVDKWFRRVGDGLNGGSEVSGMYNNVKGVKKTKPVGFNKPTPKKGFKFFRFGK